MAVKGIAHIVSAAFNQDSEITLQVYMQTVDSSGTITYGPVSPSAVNDTALAAWAKDYMNNNWNADIGMLDTVKLIVSIGGLL